VAGPEGQGAARRAGGRNPEGVKTRTLDSAI
jgi:hypothetical protein